MQTVKHIAILPTARTGAVIAGLLAATGGLPLLVFPFLVDLALSGIWDGKSFSQAGVGLRVILYLIGVAGSAVGVGVGAGVLAVVYNAVVAQGWAEGIVVGLEDHPD